MSEAEGKRLSDAAAAAHGRGAASEAVALARRALTHSLLDPRANMIVGAAALEAGDHRAALEHLARTLKSAPNQPFAHNLLGLALKAGGDLKGARAAFARAGDLGFAGAWLNLGTLEGEEGDTLAAANAYEKTLALQPDNAVAHAALALVLERRHDLDAAVRHARHALSLNSGNTLARLALAQVALREKEFAAAEREALALTTEAESANNRSWAWGMVGEARDRLGRAHEAFAAFTEANRLQLELYGELLSEQHRASHTAGVRRMLALAKRTRDAAPTAGDGDAPVFLVGFPRSGTTLLDQVLSSHSAIVGMEERDVFAECVRDLLKDEARLAALSRISAEDAAARRAAYWRAADAMAPDRGDRMLLDKFPLNVVVLPLIHMVFPHAKVILALRDPRDCVLSCFQQRFGMNASMVQFLELPNAAAYYDLSMQVFEACKERFCANLHVVRYEDVVADLEGEARKFAAFLGIAFEPAMLGYVETARARPINTPSMRQVIEPIYGRAVGKWRAYAEEIAPVLPQLNAWAERLGYPT